MSCSSILPTRKRNSPIERQQCFQPDRALFGKASLAGWQFAVDGAWDAAARFFFEGAPEPILHWLGKQKSPDVAVEALFDLSDGERMFAGTRMIALAPEARASAIDTLLRKTHQADTLENVIPLLRAEFGDDGAFSSPPDFLELGVFDLWNRVKSVVVWRPGEDLLAPARIAEHAPIPDAGFGALHHPQPRQLMLEAVWKGHVRFQHWIGVPVGVLNNSTKFYSVSEMPYRTAAAALIGCGT